MRNAHNNIYQDGNGPHNGETKMTASWAIVDKSTGLAVREVRNTPKNAEAIKHLKPEYEAVPIAKYLSGLSARQ